MPLFLGFTGLFALAALWPVFFVLNYASLEVVPRHFLHSVIHSFLMHAAV